MLLYAKKHNLKIKSIKVGKNISKYLNRKLNKNNINKLIKSLSIV